MSETSEQKINRLEEEIASYRVNGAVRSRGCDSPHKWKAVLRLLIRSDCVLRAKD